VFLERWKPSIVSCLKISDGRLRKRRFRSGSVLPVFNSSKFLKERLVVFS
jgi:hypothetical protein